MRNTCYHCGDDVNGNPILFEEKPFCCHGCKSVYELLSKSELSNYYHLEQNAGIKPGTTDALKYTFLDIESIRSKYIDFEDASMTKITLFLPQIHCSSCIYLLENLNKLDAAIVQCQVNFTKREASIIFDSQQKKLSEVAFLLDKIGYPPNFGNRKDSEKKNDTTFLFKLGTAGFAFGSIMLWSFPEYLGIKGDNPEFRNTTAYLSLGVSIPVFFYSASEYFISAFKALRFRRLNLDVPITIGILALYIQSFYTILSGQGPGYMDSFAGFIFFLLIGKWFQNKTYRVLSFERDHTSYFPVAVTRKGESGEEIVEIEKLVKGNIIYVRNEEVLPCDSILLNETAKIDYSFVTGESNPILKKKNDLIYAGGKLLDQRTQFEVVNESNRSHLTQLWNDIKTNKPQTHTGFLYQNKLSFYFLIGLLIVAASAAIAWYFIDYKSITRVVVSILIVACPCALALSAPFTFGNIMRVLGRKGLYLKNTGVIERIYDVSDIVFDKTGTLTSNTKKHIEYAGNQLTSDEWKMIYCMANSSAHPLSRAIALHLQERGIKYNTQIIDFFEEKGNGVGGRINNMEVLIGNPHFCQCEKIDKNETSSFIRIGKKTGRFIFTSELREGMEYMLKHLKSFNIHLLSGDKDKDKILLAPYFETKNIHFEQTPQDKLNYILQLKKLNKKVMMIGDGLNDAGALEAADVGVAVSEDVFRFTPASDAIIEASKLNQLPNFIAISSFSKTVLKTCLIFSLSYNVVGLSFAVSGQLTPLIAAILMPVSSITVVFISTFLALSKK